jgi:hypothetical protein
MSRSRKGGSRSSPASVKIEPLGEAASSRLVKALLSIEWQHNGGGTLTCSGCGSWTFRPVHVRPENTLDKVGCYVDEALTAAGYPDQESREAGRAVIAREELRNRETRDRERREAWEDREREEESG